jgi:3-oxoacyl-[acyl-carrier protein] reductase
MGILENKRVLITGAGTGIGRAAAARFAREGAAVALLGRRRKMLEETKSYLQDGDHLVIPTDISDFDEVARAKESVLDHWGYVDILVNNAGVAVYAHPITSDLSEWIAPINVMLMGTIYCCRAFTPLIPDGGRMVMVTSIHRERAEKGASAYATAKGAVTQYVRGLALELAERSILVNAVAPGFVDTPMSVKDDGINELTKDWFIKDYVEGKHLPLRRAGNPEEIAGVVLFLAGPDASYITGETITVDGGLTITF